MAIYGGFPPGGGDGTFAVRNPDPSTNGTILSGDLAGNDINTDGNQIAESIDDLKGDDHSDHVVTGTGTGTTAVLDGFVITAGRLPAVGAGLICFDDFPARIP